MIDLVYYRQKIESKISYFLETWEGPLPLKKACAYALQNGGKRWRPMLVYLIAEALGHKNVDEAALAVELFHGASLIADDLPCMDDEKERRGKAALHVEFGESAALLASYALIASGYDCIQKNAKGMSCERLQLAIAAVSKTTGGSGATGGQYWDLFAPQEHMEAMIAQKTGALFELSFALGWIFGGGELGKLPQIQKGAQHFGIAFQIYDDILDMEEDAPKRNYALCFGKQQAEQRVAWELEQFQQCLALLPQVACDLRSLLELALAS